MAKFDSCRGCYTISNWQDATRRRRPVSAKSLGCPDDTTHGDGLVVYTPAKVACMQMMAAANQTAKRSWAAAEQLLRLFEETLYNLVPETLAAAAEGGRAQGFKIYTYEERDSSCLAPRWCSVPILSFNRSVAKFPCVIYEFWWRVARHTLLADGLHIKPLICLWRRNGQARCSIIILL